MNDFDPFSSAALLPAAVFAACMVVIVWAIRRVRRAVDARYARRWEEARDFARSTYQYVVYVHCVYQHARTGSKAVVRYLADDGWQDTWFFGWQAPTGVYLVLSRGIGWGPHNANPSVLYVYPGNVSRVVPARVVRGWVRHNRRCTRMARSGSGRPP